MINNPKINIVKINNVMINSDMINNDQDQLDDDHETLSAQNYGPSRAARPGDRLRLSAQNFRENRAAIRATIRLARKVRHMPRLSAQLLNDAARMRLALTTEVSR